MAFFGLGSYARDLLADQNHFSAPLKDFHEKTVGDKAHREAEAKA